MTNNINKYIAIEILIKSIYLEYEEHISFDDIYYCDEDDTCDECEAVNIRVKTKFGEIYYITLPNAVADYLIYKDIDDFMDEMD